MSVRAIAERIRPGGDAGLDQARAPARPPPSRVAPIEPATCSIDSASRTSLASPPRLRSINTPTAIVSPSGWRLSSKTVRASSNTASLITAAPTISDSPICSIHPGAAAARVEPRATPPPGPQLTVVELRDRRQRDRGSRVAEGRQPGDERPRRTKARDRPRRHRGTAVHAAARGRCRAGATPTPRRRAPSRPPPPTARSSARHEPPRGLRPCRACSRSWRSATRAGWPPDPRRRLPPLKPQTVDRDAAVARGRIPQLAPTPAPRAPGPLGPRPQQQQRDRRVLGLQTMPSTQETATYRQVIRNAAPWPLMSPLSVQAHEPPRSNRSRGVAPRTAGGVIASPR